HRARLQPPVRSRSDRGSATRRQIPDHLRDAPRAPRRRARADAHALRGDARLQRWRGLSGHRSGAMEFARHRRGAQPEGDRHAFAQLRSTTLAAELLDNLFFSDRAEPAWHGGMVAGIDPARRYTAREMLDLMGGPSYLKLPLQTIATKQDGNHIAVP